MNEYLCFCLTPNVCIHHSDWQEHLKIRPSEGLVRPDWANLVQMYSGGIEESK